MGKESDTDQPAELVREYGPFPGAPHVHGVSFDGSLVWFAGDERQPTTLAMLAECFEVLGGVPKTVLADRMACLKGAVVATVVVPAPDYVRFASHYRFRPDV